MNTTTNTRGVSDAMVELAERGWYSHIGKHGLDGSAFRDRLRAAIEDALSAEPAAQGDRMPVPCSVDRTHPNKACVTLGFYSEDACDRFYKAITRGKDLFTAPPAQPAERLSARLREVEDILAEVERQFRLHGDGFPDGFDHRVFRWVEDAVAGNSSKPAERVPEGEQ